MPLFHPKPPPKDLGLRHLFMALGIAILIVAAAALLWSIPFGHLAR